MAIIVLDATTETIECVMSGAPATTQPSFVSAYADNNGAAFIEGGANGALNGTNAVTVVSAPASATRRLIRGISIYNNDTAPVTVTIRLNANGTIRNLIKETIAAGDRFAWPDEIIVLKSTTESLRAALSGAITTANPSFFVSYADNGTSFVEGNSFGALNGITPVSIVSSPAASTRRVIKQIRVYNNDTASATITISLYDSTSPAVTRNIIKTTLAAGASYVWPVAAASAGGSGDVAGPGSSTDSNFASFDGSDGKTIKDSGTKASDFATAGHNHSGDYDPYGAAAGKADKVATSPDPTGRLAKFDAAGNLVVSTKSESDIGAGGGDVIGPATNSNLYLPQWDGANSKTLKNGMEVTTSIGDPGADTKMPTEKAVRSAIAGVGGGGTDFLVMQVFS